MRNVLGRSPPLASQLKIYGFDDATFSAMKTDQLTTEDWATLIRYIGKSRPRAIVIDKMFTELPAYLGQGKPLLDAI